MIEQIFLDKVAPEMREELAAVETALETLNMAAGSFRKATEAMPT